MRRQLMGILAAAVITLGCIFPVRAASGTGEIRVGLDFADGEVHEGSVRLYRVGQKVQGYYRLENSFGGGLVKEEDACSPALALWLREAAQEEGMPRILDMDGTACYQNLPAGLYLLVQNEKITGLDPFEPMLMELPWDGAWQIAAYPQYRMVVAQSPQTGDAGMLYFWTMVMVVSGQGILLCLKRLYRK